MKIPPYTEVLTESFREDFAVVGEYIIDSNVEAGNDVEFAIEKAEQFEKEVRDLIKDLTLFPEQGTIKATSAVRGKPVYDGRYSIRWVVNHDAREVSLIAIHDNERPKELRYGQAMSDV
ncbi:hypothetical protein [Bdellovibrio sp. HCB-162]|uniref:hypothetical protein n=1 Tax=Bdellovibrio sp. HCB-162 TaxID=3394234 RepID=UPI0039BCE18C